MKNIFCARKGGATINGKFYYHPSVSELWEDRVTKAANKMAERRAKWTEKK